MDTATWDESNPEDIICVVGARGKSQAIHGRTVEETQNRIPKVMVSEFRMSQPEADEFAAMAAGQRGKQNAAVNEQAAKLQHAQDLVKALTERSQKQEALQKATEKERDDAVAERDRLSGELTVAKAALQRAQTQIETLRKPPAPPPVPVPPKTEDEKPSAETSTDGQADKAS